MGVRPSVVFFGGGKGVIKKKLGFDMSPPGTRKNVLDFQTEKISFFYATQHFINTD